MVDYLRYLKIQIKWICDIYKKEILFAGYIGNCFYYSYKTALTMIPTVKMNGDMEVTMGMDVQAHTQTSSVKYTKMFTEMS